MGLYVSAGPARQLAKQALAARLYNETGLLAHYLETFTAGHSTGAIAILSDEEQHYYGVAMVCPDGLAMAFVRPDIRGHGWGQKLVQAALATRTNPTVPPYALPSDHTPKGAKFWRKCGVTELKSHDYAPTMHRSDFYVWQEKGRVLLERYPSVVEQHTLEALYIQQLYGDEYSDLHDGIRGRLYQYFEEGVASFEYILFHYSHRYDSCAMLIERMQDINGEPTKVLELQLYVRPELRRQGLGQEIIDRVKTMYPTQTLYGYHTDTSRSLLKRNGVIDLKRAPHASV